MRTSVFAFFIAMFAMLCSTVVASQELEKRGGKAVSEFDAVVDMLFKFNSHLMAKAFGEVCTDLDIDAAVSSGLKVKVTGLVNVDVGLAAKLSAGLHASIKAAIKAEVKAAIKGEVDAHFKANIAAIIAKRCPNKDAASIRLQAKFIVSEAAKLTVKTSAKISAKIQAKIQLKVKAAIDAKIKASINLIILKIQVTGDADISKSLALKFKAVAGICAKACLDITVKEVAQIKKICKA